MNKFGTSDNFQTGSYNVVTSGGKGFKHRNNNQDVYDNRTDGFNKHNDLKRNAQSPPNYSQFISEPSQVEVNENEDEEMIEEDIVQSQTDSPIINAHTKQMHGKAKVLFPQQPPIFQSTESDKFREGGMTGFSNAQQKMNSIATPL